MTNEEEKVANNGEPKAEDDELLDPNDFEDNEDEKDESVKIEDIKVENKDKNSYFAQRRREQEAKAKEKSNADIIEKERNDAYLKGKLDATKVNKFTDEPINDEYDLELYEIQLELDKQGKDPINDLAQELASRKRSQVKLEKEKISKENAQKEEMQKDISNFVKAYPKVNTQELSNNESFVKFAENKWGRWSMIEIYEAYLDKQSISNNESKNKSIDETAEKMAKQYNKMPSSKNSNHSEDTSNANETFEEFKARFDKKYR